MYAETFDVRAWLEPACKWLRWAMQSIPSRKLKDARYNLQQFWKALEPFKRQAKTARDWSEILVLDSQSQWTLASLCGAEQTAIMLEMANYSAAKRTSADLMPPVKWVDWAMKKAFDYQDAGLAAAAKKVQDLGDQAEQANQRAAALARQAETADTQARTEDATIPKGQAGNTRHVTDYTAPMVTQRNQSAQKTTGGIIRQDQAPPTFPSFGIGNPFTFKLWGLPVWAWGALGVGVLLLLTPSTPRVSFSTGGQR